MNKALLLVLVITSCGGRTVLSVDDDLGLPNPTAAPPGPPVADAGADAPHDAEAADAAPPGCFDAGVTVLAADQVAPSAIAVDATHVYWTVTGSDCPDGELRRMHKAGGPIETLVSGLRNPRALALDQERVYVYTACGPGTLLRVPKAGGAPVDYGVDVSDTARALAVGGQDIYFNDYGLLRIPKDGGAQSVIDAQTYVYELAADDAGVYWVGPIDTFTYGLLSYHPGDAAPTTLASMSIVGSGIAIDAESIFFGGGSGIARVPKGGGPISDVVAGYAWTIAVDEGSVYWSEGFLDTYSIKKAPKTGGEATLVGTRDGAYATLVVDDRCVYVANLHGNSIDSMPK